MYFTLLSFVIYGALFLAAFILSIVAMAQGRVTGGITLLLATLIVPSIFGSLFGFRVVNFAESLSSETRVQGHVISPQGMTLSNEVWIVSDFHEISSGIAQDLAAERAPLMQEIQERQEKVKMARQPPELQQAQADLAQAQIAAASLDDKYYKQLYSLPDENITNRIPLNANGHFTWNDDRIFAEGEKQHSYWFFARATRADGRQYWALHPFSTSKDQRLELDIEPKDFVSTKAILQPNLPPSELE